MSFVSSTPLGLVLFVLILMLGPKRGLWVLFAAMPFGATAVLLAKGGGSVLLLDLCVLGYVLATFIRVHLSSFWAALLPGRAGFPLWLLVSFAVLGAWFLPQVFAGKSSVYSVTSVDGRAMIDLIPLTMSGTHVVQTGRLLLGWLLFLAITATDWKVLDQAIVLRAVVVASCAHLAMSLLDWMTAPMGLAYLLDPLRTISQAVLVDQHFGSVRRLIGGYTEPASFGLYTMGLYGFWLSVYFGKMHVSGSGVWVLALAVLAIRSTSTATIANLLVFTICFVLWQGRQIATRPVWANLWAVTIAALPLVIAAGAVLMAYSAIAQMLADELFWDKAVSISGQERFRWNRQALINLKDSYGLGLGLGSVRASGWGFAVLGNLGLPGAIFFAWFLIKVFWPPIGMASSQNPLLETISALRCGAAAILLQSVMTTPYPNLGLPFFAMCGLAAALGRAGQMTRPNTGSWPRQSEWQVKGAA